MWGVACMHILTKNIPSIFIIVNLVKTGAINENVYKEFEAFTCTMYGYARETSINAVRSKRLRKMVGEDKALDIESKIDLARLPPCQDSLAPESKPLVSWL